MSENSVRLLAFVIYTIFYECLIWGLFGWAVFINGNSGWWLLLAVFVSASQLKAETFGVSKHGGL